jgi:hypothetical protein
VAQRFTAAITASFSMTASAAEVMLPTEKHFFRNPFSRAAKRLAPDDNSNIMLET